MRPTCLLPSSPMCLQVPPPSTDLYTPLPQPDDCRFCGSPVPTQTRFGFDWSSVTAPIELVGWSSKTGVHEVPWFSVFQTPPVPVATKNTCGFDSTTAMSAMRPPMSAGPSSRYWRCEIAVSSADWA